MNKFSLCVIALMLLCIILDPASCGRGQKMKITTKTKTSNFGNTLTTKTKTKISYKPRSSVSGSMRTALWTGGGFVAGMYVANAMRGSSYYGSMHRDTRFNFCQGRYSDAPIGSTYYACPSDPHRMWENQCCVDDFGNGMCCSSNYGGYSSGTAIGSTISALIVLLAFGACIYCCFFKQRNQDVVKTTTTTVYMTEPEVQHVVTNSSPMMTNYQQQPGPGYPTKPNTDIGFAGAPSYPPPAQAPAYNAPGAPGTGWNSTPPPPYPSN